VRSADVIYAAFFRNLNLGRPNCPNKGEFEAAFIAAGATSALSFLSNGTLVFATSSSARARNILARACALLADSCGLKEPAYIRSVAYLADLVTRDPFAAVAPGSVHECCVSFLPVDSSSALLLPLESKRGDVRVLHGTGTEVFSVSLTVAKSPGSPNAFLEKWLGRPVTTRSWNTLCRLVRRHA
jgi:uncharacterized protein (DUF1697 family)